MSSEQLAKRGWAMAHNNQDRCVHADGRVLTRKENRRWYLGKKRLYASLTDSVIEADKIKAGRVTA